MYSREASNVSIFKTKWTLQLAVAAASDSANSNFSADAAVHQFGLTMQLSRITILLPLHFFTVFTTFIGPVYGEEPDEDADQFR